jgi:hypothetical protein
MKKLAMLPIAAAAFMLMPGPERAEAVVYCKTVGVPKGCVMRPAPAAAVIYCTAPGVPVGCVARPAARGAVVRSPVNRGGPVNRAGVR